MNAKTGFADSHGREEDVRVQAASFPNPATFGSVFKADEEFLDRNEGRAQADVPWIAGGGHWALCHVRKGGEESAYRLWDLSTRTLVRRFDKYLGALSPDGRQFLRGGPGHTIELYETDTDQKVRTFVGHARSLAAIAFFPDGQRIASIADDGWALVWNVEGEGRNPDKEWQHEFPHKHQPSCLAISSDGRRIATGDVEGNLAVWDVDTEKPVGRPILQQLDRFVDKRRRGGAHIADLDGNRVGKEWSDGAVVKQVAFLPGNDRIVACTNDGYVVVFDAISGEELARHVEDGTYPPFTALTVSPNDRHILFATYPGPIRVWDWARGKFVAQFDGHFRMEGGWERRPGGVRCIVVSPDGKHALSGGEDGTVRLWKLPE